MKKLFSIVALTALLFASSAKATPYASSVTNDNGTIRFILNEDAGDVGVTFNNGTSSNNLGALLKGPNSFNLDTATNFQIYVSKTSAPGFVRTNGANINVAGTTNAAGAVIPNSLGFSNQISSDANTLMYFWAGRGITVSRDPKSPYFGRIYVANATVGTTSSNGIARTLGDGIYVLNPDQTDALGQGDTPLNGGLDFATGGASSPYRLTIGQDNNLYISDWSDSVGSLYVTDPNVTVGQNVLGGDVGGLVPVGTTRVHGSISAAIVEGSLANNNLKAWVVDEDLQTNRDQTTTNMANTLWQHDIGGSIPGALVMPTLRFTPSGQAGINSVSQIVDLDRGLSGHFYYTDFRSGGTDTSGLIVRTSTGGAAWNSRQTSTNLIGGGTVDILKTSYATAVSPDQKYVAVMRQDSRTWIIPLTNNLPDLARRIWIHTFPSITSGRGVRFDAAGNLYALSSGAEELKIYSPGGTTLTITGGDASGTNGTFKLITAPVFRVQPTNQTMNAGATLATVSYVEGMGSASYQWQLNGTNITGATSAVYTKANVQQTNAGTYTLIVSNELGVVTSSNAVITVTDIAPNITASPVDRTVFAGSNVVFTVTAVGTDPKTYQWFFEGNPISGATASSYTRSNAQSTNQGNYSVTVSNSVNVTSSTNSFLTVTDTGPVIYTNPTSRTNGAGANSTFSVNAYGTDPRFYQWQFAGVDIPNATGTSYTRTNVQPGIDEGNYTVIVSNSINIATSTAGVLTVTNRAPVINTQPKSATNDVGTSVTFTVVAVGTDPISYQWLFGGNPIANATTSSYNIASVDLTNAGIYSVILTNVVGTNTSSNAVLTVNAPVVAAPVIQPLAGAGTTNVVITWSSVNGSTYRVQYNPDLNTTNWTTIADVVASGTTASTTNNPGIADQRYYRVILLGP